MTARRENQCWTWADSRSAVRLTLYLWEHSYLGQSGVFRHLVSGHGIGMIVCILQTFLSEKVGTIVSGLVDELGLTLSQCYLAVCATVAQQLRNGVGNRRNTQMFSLRSSFTLTSRNIAAAQLWG